MTRGLSRPRRARSRSTAWGSREARRRAVGSKVARTKPKRRNDAIRRTGIEYAIRRATYENISCLRYADHDVDGARHQPGPVVHVTNRSLLVQPPEVGVEERPHDRV